VVRRRASDQTKSDEAAAALSGERDDDEWLPGKLLSGDQTESLVGAAYGSGAGGSIGIGDGAGREGHSAFSLVVSSGLAEGFSGGSSSISVVKIIASLYLI
jgi:hypothetical protein